jgi:hypothetical protein
MDVEAEGSIAHLCGGFADRESFRVFGLRFDVHLEHFFLLLKRSKLPTSRRRKLSRLLLRRSLRLHYGKPTMATSTSSFESPRLLHQFASVGQRVGDDRIAGASNLL